MQANLKALFVDQDRSSLDKFTSALSPDIYFIDSRHASSCHEGLNKILEEPAQICFVSDQLPQDEVMSLARDIRTTDNLKHCILVRVKNSLPAEVDRSTVKGEQFDTVISRSCSKSDKEAVIEIVQKIARENEHHEQFKQKVIDVEEAISLLINDLDTVARSVKRGSKRQFKKDSSEFIKYLTSIDQELLSQYIELFTDEAEEHKPVGFDKLNVPKEILELGLPLLKGDTYTGSSDRLWLRLAKKYGLSKEAIAQRPSLRERRKLAKKKAAEENK